MNGTSKGFSLGWARRQRDDVNAEGDAGAAETTLRVSAEGIAPGGYGRHDASGHADHALLPRLNLSASDESLTL